MQSVYFHPLFLTILSIHSSIHRGSLEIHAEAQTNTRDLLHVSFRGYKLANKDGFFGTSDPFLVISR